MTIMLKSVEDHVDVEFACSLLAVRGGSIHFSERSVLDFSAKFHERLARFYHSFAILVDLTTQELVGVACSWDYYRYDGHCKIDVFLIEESNEIFAEATKTWLQQLRRDYPLRRVWLELTSDSPRVNVAIEMGFRIETILKDYRFVDGDYKDVAILGYSLDAVEQIDSVSEAR